MKKSIYAIIAALTGGMIGSGIMSRICSKRVIREKDANEKMVEFYHVLNRWLRLKQEGKSLTEYFIKNEYQTIAIYGMKELGERLYDEIKDSNIKVQYVIDQNAQNIFAEVKAVTPDDQLEQVDAIVVTAIHYYEEIADQLRDKTNIPILSIEDIVYEME